MADAQNTPGLEERIVAEVMAQLPDRAAAQAAEMGLAPGHKRLTGEDEFRAWMMADPTVDEVALVEQGEDPWVATFKRYPKRLEMILGAGTTVDEQVEYAERMRKEVLKRMGMDPNVPPGWAAGPANPTPEDVGMTPGPAPSRPAVDAVPAGFQPGPAPVRPAVDMAA